MKTINIPRGNTFTLHLPIFRRIFETGQPVDELVDISNELTAVAVEVMHNGEVALYTFEVVNYNILAVVLPSSLETGSYDVSVTATSVSGGEVAVWYKCGFCIVDYNYQSDYTDYVAGSPILLPAMPYVDALNAVLPNYAMQQTADGYQLTKDGAPVGVEIPKICESCIVADAVARSEAYTDEKAENTLQSAQAYTVEQVSAERAEREAKDADTLASAKAYTDELLTEAGRRNLLAYGIERDKTVASPTCTRIGNLSMHKTLPVQSLMRGCLLDDDGHVVKYLNPNDWTGEVRDGSLGQVMVEIPEHYRLFETEGNIQRVWLSLYPLDGFHRVPKAYMSAYQATIDRTDTANFKLASVVNTTPEFRGGNNAAQYDDTYRTQLGRAASTLSFPRCRQYARNRKAGSAEWNMQVYDVWKSIVWLFVVEYATLNSQLPFTAELTAEGYHQGGLGNGAVTLTEREFIDHYNRQACMPVGWTDEFGNQSGVKTFTCTNGEDWTKDEEINRYRGIECPWGNVVIWQDGVIVKAYTDDEDVKHAEVWVCHNPEQFVSENFEDNYTYVGDMETSGSRIKEILFGEGGELACTVGGATWTTFFCDNLNLYAFATRNASLLSSCSEGAAPNYGVGGIFSGRSDLSVMSVSANNWTGTRLTFIPIE